MTPNSEGETQGEGWLGRYLRLGGAPMMVCAHAMGVWGHAPPEKNRCSEIASEAIFVLKFIFRLDAARIPALSVFWSATCHVTRQSVTGSPRQFTEGQILTKGGARASGTPSFTTYVMKSYSYILSMIKKHIMTVILACIGSTLWVRRLLTKSPS